MLVKPHIYKSNMHNPVNSHDQAKGDSCYVLPRMSSLAVCAIYFDHCSLSRSSNQWYNNANPLIDFFETHAQLLYGSDFTEQARQRPQI